ncbi:MAG TPA: Flp pilus assembly protein CpaB [Actinobacteria bacterium]|nr:Flp pilus assembly protein CpaB [Actinomycetota bacterium]HCP62358.1 Flp pilus assembly protein CpaB [Actinomycetota bacterium]
MKRRSQDGRARGGSDARAPGESGHAQPEHGGGSGSDRSTGETTGWRAWSPPDQGPRDPNDPPATAGSIDRRGRQRGRATGASRSPGTRAKASAWSRTSRRYLTASLVLAALSFVMLARVAGSASAARGADGAVQPIAVAAEEIAAGVVLRPSQIRVEMFPRAFAPPGALTSASQAAGRVALTGLHVGEAVTDTRLARVRAGPVASLVPQGLRAFAVPTALPPSLVRPGDRVDLLATFGSEHPHTELVASALEVLSVLGDAGTSAQPGLLDASGSGAQSAATLLLLVTPDQELQLAAAASVANLEVTIDPAD